tara:strand:+ start:2117 stop:4858 length:2742 start_codon:yes stop_codon:yes gene_type:complete
MRTTLCALLVGLLPALAVSPVFAKPVGELKTPSQRYASADTTEEVSFRRHVIPLFSRAGCSGRECHGAFAGQGGFSLSLFGYDFDKDHKEIVADEADGIRVELDSPTDSLILLKPTMQERHKGKERIKLGSWEYNLVLKWIKDGAKIDVKETGAFGRLEILPKEIVFSKANQEVQLKVLCHWEDGTVEDVTQLTRFRTNDESVAEVSDTGVVKSLSGGDTHIVAFYDNGVQPIPVMLPVSEKVGDRFPKITTNTKIDELVVNKLRKVGIIPSELCTDLEFLRRVTLDMTGTLPSPEEVKAFQANPSANKRTAKIEELLERDTYAAWWATKLNDFTGNNAQQIGDRYYRNEQSRQWYDWVRARIAKNEPYDKMVAGIVLATSRQGNQSYLDYARQMSTYYKKSNPRDFSKRETMPHYWSRRNIRKPEEKALSFAHAFLGVQIQCAQCHKHPFDQWTQQDFNQFQAFFTGIQYGNRTDIKEDVNYRTMSAQIEKDIGYDRKKTESRRKLQNEIKKRVSMGRPVPWQELYVRKTAARKPNNRKKKTNTGSSRVLTPKILGGDEVHLTEYPDPRAPLMEWMRSKENPYFARAFVNRVWANYFGRGIVEPADDMNLANPPSNGELLDYLADGFVENGYDMKWLHKTIASSDTYQRSWRPNDTNKLDEKNFSKMKLRRLPAEVVADAINMAVAGEKRVEKFVEDMEERMIGPMLTGGNNGRANYALSLFGKPVRLTNCDCERTSDPTLLQTLYTRNDYDMLGKIDSNSGKSMSWIGELRKQTAPDRKLVSKFASIASLKKRVKQFETRQAGYQRTRDKVKSEQQKKRYGQQVKSMQKQIDRTQKQIDDLEKERRAHAEANKLDTDDLIEQTFLRTVSRPPTKNELTMAREDIAGAKTQLDGVRDLLWAMLNTKEFIINH